MKRRSFAGTRRGSAHNMRRMKTKVIKSAMSVALACMLPSLAHAGSYPERMGKIKMDAYINLPAPGSLIAVKRGNEILLMSGNGRYMVRGAIYDMWNGGKRITSIDEAKESARHIKFNSMGLHLDELATVDVGEQGKPQVVIFIDPSSKQSMNLMKQLNDVHGYSFKIIVVGAIDKQSAAKAKGLMCLAEKDEDKARDALLSGDLSFVQNGECGKEKLLKTLMTATMFGINRLPFIVAPNGEYAIGTPKDITDFLERNKE